MVEHFENVLRARRPKTVVKRRSGVEKNQTRAVDRAANYVPGVAAQDRKSQQHTEAGEAQGKSDPVRDAVSEFV